MSTTKLFLTAPSVIAVCPSSGTATPGRGGGGRLDLRAPMYDIVGESVRASVLASFDLSDKTGLSAILFINFFDSVKFIVNKFDLSFIQCLVILTKKKHY
jgi:hypothetical protein